MFKFVTFHGPRGTLLTVPVSVGYLSGIGGVGTAGMLPRETTGDRMPTDCSDADEPLNGDGSGDAALARSPLHSESEYWMLWYSWPVFCIRCTTTQNWPHSKCHQPHSDLCPWPTIQGELRTWPRHAKNQGQRSVRSKNSGNKWRNIDRWIEPIPSFYVLTQSVIILQQWHNYHLLLPHHMSSTECSGITLDMAI